MKIEEFIHRLQILPEALSHEEHQALDDAGDIVVRKARQRIPVWKGPRPDPHAGTIRASIRARRQSENVEQIYSNHPGAEVNEQDPRWRNPPRHWLTTSLIDSMPEIMQLFAVGARQAIRSVIR